MRRLTCTFTTAVVAVALSAGPLSAGIPTITGPSFNLHATSGHLLTPDGNSIFFWGYRDVTGGTLVQYPGPTLEVNEGQTVNVTLTSDLPTHTSLIFPGQSGVTVTGTAGPNQPGLLSAVEIPAGSSVTYSFVASEPGTYEYHSGTRADLQKMMGLFGALIVRPTGYVFGNPAQTHVYNGDETNRYDREYLVLHSEMDSRINRAVEIAGGIPTGLDTTTYFPVYWFYNGRAAPDTFYFDDAVDPVVNPEPGGSKLLPNQPYSGLFMMRPGEKILTRIIGGTRDGHPFHAHGNHELQVGRCGRLLSSGGPAADLAIRTFSVMSWPGQTVDAIFEWTGEALGWDIYGHDPGDPLEPEEDPADHGKPFPVLLPEGLDLNFGGLWPGSPFLGQLSDLPPGEGGNNPSGAYTYLWHNHLGREIVNNDIFPGGQVAVMLIQHPDEDLSVTGDGIP